MVRIMCGAALVDSVGRLTGWLYTAEGHTRQQLVWSMVSTGVTVAAVLAAASHGAVSVTWAFAVAVAALAIPGIVYCLRTSLLTGQEFIRAIWRPCVATAVAAGVWMPVRASVTTPNADILALTVDALVFGLIYLAAWVGLPGGRQATREARELVRAIMDRTPAGEQEP